MERRPRPIARPSSRRHPMATATSSRAAGKAARSPESYQSFEQREAAAQILQSYEELSWWSFARCESITQTRLHFQNIVAGFSASDEAKHIDYKDDLTPHPAKPGEEPKPSRKGKERQSAGGGDGFAGSSSAASPAGGKAKQTREKSDADRGSSAVRDKKKRRSVIGDED